MWLSKNIYIYKKNKTKKKQKNKKQKQNIEKEKKNTESPALETKPYLFSTAQFHKLFFFQILTFLCVQPYLRWITVN